MRTLEDFSAPRDGEVTLCEIDGVLQSANYSFASVNVFTTTVEKHPQIHITRNVLHPSSSREESRALFLPVHEPLLKKLTKIYYEQGLQQVLETATYAEHIIVSKCATAVLNALQLINKIRNVFNPSIRESNVKVIDEHSQTQDWYTSPIRCFAWHEYCSKIAVASLDDVVRIYLSESNFIPLLKCQQQKKVTCLAWRPMSLSDIAVGCEDRIIIWTVDPTSVVTRPSISNAIIIQRNGHSPVISLAWSPRGDVLASAASNDSTVLMWDVELDQTSSLKRPGYTGNTLLKWSAAGDKLFCASNGLVFRVWNCRNWQPERWTIQSGRVQTACWSNCGTLLFFATTQEPIIYSLTFLKTDVFAAESDNSSNQAIPLFDMSKVDVDGVFVGGIIRCMDTDPKGKYLAVMFQDSDYVAVFGVQKFPTLSLSSSFLINGLPDERPTLIEFQKDFIYGACLSIAWSSGRLQHFPIVFTEDTPNVTNPCLCNNSFNTVSPNSYF